MGIYLVYLLGQVSTNIMTIKNKNLLTAVILVSVALIVYLFAVAQAVSQ
jgi:hypothetical protein